MTWEFDGEGGGGYTPPPVTTPAYTPPVDTYTPPTTTSTPPPPPTTTSTSSSSSSSSSAPAVSALEVDPAASSANPAPSQDAQPGNALENAGAAAFYLGKLVSAAVDA